MELTNTLQSDNPLAPHQNQNQNRFQPLQQQRWGEKGKPSSPVVEHKTPEKQEHGIGDKNMAYNPELQTDFAVSTSESEVSFDNILVHFPAHFLHVLRLPREKGR